MGRYALLVGISNYLRDRTLNPLPRAVLDVEALREVLIDPEIGGFEESAVRVLQDVEKGAIEAAIYELFAKRRPEDLVLFYFSGHGVVDDRDKFYLTGSTTQSSSLPPTAVSSKYIHDEMNGSRSQHQVIILDCCNSGAFPEGMKGKKSVTVKALPELGGEGRAILAASDSSQYAFEEKGFELSLYTHFLVEGLKTGAADRDEDGQVSVNELHLYAEEKVKSVNDRMTPKFYGVMKGGQPIYLAKAAQGDPKLKFRKEVEKIVVRSNGVISAIARKLLTRKWQELKINPSDSDVIINEVLRPYIEYSKKLEEYEQTLLDAIEERFPFNEIMQAELQEYEKHLGLREEDVLAIVSRIIEPKQVEYLQLLGIKQSQQEKEIILDLGDGITLDLVQIPAGKFMMGSNDYDNEKPIHEVTVQSFLIGKYAITNAQWFTVMGTEPSKQYDVIFQGDNQPVVGVSWHDCNKFCKKLSAETRREFRLPSEAEWEYACRAGTQTKYHFGDDENQLGSYAWYRNNSNSQTHPVGEKHPNQFELYDMHGNVWEWCLDEWHDNYNSKPESLKANGNEPWGEIRVDDNDNRSRLLRGGSWYYGAGYCRSASRGGNVARDQVNDLGFRVVCRL